MKAPEQNKRPRRRTLTREEVQAVIAFKQRKENIQLHKLKGTLSYKLRNVFLIISFFIFSEVLICFFGPCKHRLHYTMRVAGTYAAHFEKGKGQLLSQIEAICVDGTMFQLQVDDFKKTPPKYTTLDVGSDFLLNCELKASIAGVEGSFRLFRANPVLLLCCFSSVMLVFGIYHNFNHNDYALWGLTVICGMTLLYLLCI